MRLHSPTEKMIKNYNGQVIGYIYTDSSGNKIIRNKNNIIVGYYDKTSNVTKDRYNIIKYRGDFSLSLLDKE